MQINSLIVSILLINLSAVPLGFGKGNDRAYLDLGSLKIKNQKNVSKPEILSYNY